MNYRSQLLARALNDLAAAEATALAYFNAPPGERQAARDEVVFRFENARRAIAALKEDR